MSAESIPTAGTEIQPGDDVLVRKMKASLAAKAAQQYRVVTIWHNVEVRDGRPMGFGGYETGHAMSPVFVYVAEQAEHIPEGAFRMFNAPEEYLTGEELAITRQYRANRLRSLSVGDIVQAGPEFWVCEPDGWAKLGTNVPLNVQPSPYAGKSWSGTARQELPRARHDYARAVYADTLERTGSEAEAARAFDNTRNGAKQC
jgi:hypothetical protein